MLVSHMAMIIIIFIYIYIHIIIEESSIYLVVFSREWMGWGLLGLLLIVIVDHSRKFSTFSTSK